VFGRFSGERAAARKEMLLPRLNRGDQTVVVDDDDVGGPPLRVLNVRLRGAEDKRLGHVGFYTHLRSRPRAASSGLERQLSKGFVQSQRDATGGDYVAMVVEGGDERDAERGGG